MPHYHTASASAPAHGAVAVTPGNSTDIRPTRSLFVGGTGDVTVDMATEGTNVTFTAVPAGSILPIQVTRVYSTGTTATFIVALY